MTGDGPRAAVLVIGNEVLSGRTQDVNLAYLGGELGALGIPVAEARVIADDPAAIIDAVNHLRRAYTYVFTTGGIGPTHDDITSQCIADAFGVALERNADALSRLKEHYTEADLTEGRLSMADIPAGAALIDNPVSKAPGFYLENVFVLAGVPSIAKAMFEGIRHVLKGGEPVLSKTITAAIGEGLLADPLGEVQAAHGDVEIGSYPFFRSGAFGVSVVVRGTDESAIDAALDAVKGVVADLGGSLL